MSDTEDRSHDGEEITRKKRTASRQLTKDDNADSDGESEPQGPWQRAGPEVLQKRKLYKAKRSTDTASASRASLSAGSAPANAVASSVSLGAFSFNLPAQNTNETVPAPELVTMSSTNSISAPDSTAPKAVDAAPDPTSTEQALAEPKAMAFTFGQASFSFPSNIQPTLSAAGEKKDDAKPSPFQFGSTGFPAIGAAAFKFTFPLAANATPPDMKTQGTASKFDPHAIKALASQEPGGSFNLFGKDIPVGAGFTFGNAPAAAPAQQDADADATALTEEAEPPQQPTVVLEPSVTGEEDEDNLFQEKCKLYEFDKDSKQWIEKGTGRIKLNKSKSSSKARLLMRTEPAHRLAINGTIPPSLPISIDPKRKKVINVTLPAAYVMGHESATPSEMSILSIRFVDEQHAAVLKDLITKEATSNQTSNNTEPQQTTTKPTEEGEPVKK